MTILQSDPQLIMIRRSAAQLLAYVVHDQFPNTSLLGGGTTDIGFYYDFLFEQPLHPEALSLLEVKMRQLIKENLEIRTLSMMRENAADLLQHHGQPVVAEKALEDPRNVIEIWQLEAFYGLAEGPHIEATSQIGALKLLEAKEICHFFNEEEQVVTRILGTAFPSAQELKSFLKALDGLKKRDHRLLGPELNLLSFEESASGMGCFWHPKGNFLYESIKKWIENRLNSSVFWVKTPYRAAHDEFSEYSNCGSSRAEQHIELFKRLKVNTPYQLAEWTSLFEFQLEEEMKGLFQPASYQMDQQTLFCSPQQLSANLISSLHFIKQIVTIFGFETQWVLMASSRESRALEELKQALKSGSIEYRLELQDKKSSNPRIEVRWIDQLGREWLGPFVEIVLNVESLPSIRVITRSLLGPVDRFIALLIEETAGELPMWLAPEQIRVVAISESQRAYADSVHEQIEKQGFRVQIDSRNEKLSAKIHAAEKEKIPYIVIIGDQEQINKTVTIRSLQQKRGNRTMRLEQFLEWILQEKSPIPSET